MIGLLEPLLVGYPRAVACLDIEKGFVVSAPLSHQSVQVYRADDE